MNLTKLQRAALAATLVGGVWLTSSAGTEPSTAVEYSFRNLPLNSLGIKSLAELRGKPVIIDFWGKN